jgi:hypothetical protein
VALVPSYASICGRLGPSMVSVGAPTVVVLETRGNKVCVWWGIGTYSLYKVNHRDLNVGFETVGLYWFRLVL